MYYMSMYVFICNLEHQFATWVLAYFYQMSAQGFFS